MNIKELVRIEDVIQAYGIKLGRNNKASCPFHKEKDASFSVNPSKQYFKCFGCGVGGDVIAFTMKLFNISYAQALLRINCDFNLNIINEKPDYRTTIRIKQQKEKKEKIKQFEKLVYEYFVLEFKQLDCLFELLKPQNFGDELSDEFIDILQRQAFVEDWLLNRRVNCGTKRA